MASGTRPRARTFPRRFGCRLIPAWESRWVDCGMTGRLRLRALGATAAEGPATATMARPKSRSPAGMKAGKRPTGEGCRPLGHRAGGRPGRGAGCAVRAGGKPLVVALSARQPMRAGPRSLPETLPAGPAYRRHSPLPTGRTVALGGLLCGRGRTGGTPAGDPPAKRAKRVALKRPR